MNKKTMEKLVAFIKEFKPEKIIFEDKDYNRFFKLFFHYTGEKRDKGFFLLKIRDTSILPLGIIKNSYIQELSNECDPFLGEIWKSYKERIITKILKKNI